MVDFVHLVLRHSVVHHVKNPLVIPQLSGSTQEFIKGRRRSFANSDPLIFRYVGNLLAIHQPSVGTQRFIQERNLTSFLIKVVFYYFRQFECTKELLQGRHLSVVHCVWFLQGFLWTCYSLKSSYRRQTFHVSLLEHVLNYKKHDTTNIQRTVGFHIIIL
jgi:hypothetical protein